MMCSVQPGGTCSRARPPPNLRPSCTNHYETSLATSKTLQPGPGLDKLSWTYYRSYSRSEKITVIY